ncbi:MAG: oxygen-dependent coproporphyrinogen oxidase [Acidiferrobacteraceae bacterium]|nr:oxygen-dependent coproporphyrinogen oxidase [Acidiferrobacteraceae bacterium]|tara:strand:+ start:1488 stop:2405 length:918 start_codon:yes stop_codon:yes gene_type:complete
MSELPIIDVETYFRSLQKYICGELELADGRGEFHNDNWSKSNGEGITSVLSSGDVFEQVGVNFSKVRGDKMPPAATAIRNKLTGNTFQAMGVSVIVHPLNPYVPTSHMNVRFFLSEDSQQTQAWWFGGGFDLTPYYGYVEDAVHWHTLARNACQPFGTELYPKFKQKCDDYFRIEHRDEQRGIGGLFFDDFNERSFSHSFGLTQSIGNHFLPAYLPIVEKRKNVTFGDHQRQFQLFRRGRYVEFNLLHDRGTRFGLQSGGRTPSILISLPPQATWQYEKPTNKKDTPEERLSDEFLQPKDWLVDS